VDRSGRKEGKKEGRKEKKGGRKYTTYQEIDSKYNER
jgi:hypothetical protein